MNILRKMLHAARDILLPKSNKQKSSSLKQKAEYVISIPGFQRTDANQTLLGNEIYSDRIKKFMSSINTKIGDAKNEDGSIRTPNKALAERNRDLKKFISIVNEVHETYEKLPKKTQQSLNIVNMQQVILNCTSILRHTFNQNAAKTSIPLEALTKVTNPFLKASQSSTREEEKELLIQHACKQVQKATRETQGTRRQMKLNELGRKLNNQTVFDVLLAVKDDLSNSDKRAISTSASYLIKKNSEATTTQERDANTRKFTKHLLHAAERSKASSFYICALKRSLSKPAP